MQGFERCVLISDKNKIGFGGGCHWCTEAVFCALDGVDNVESGFVLSESPDDTFSEGVRLEFNPYKIELSVLIEVHLRTHASTSLHKMRGKYRSAIYVFSDQQAAMVKGHLASLQLEFESPIVTQVLAFVDFKHVDERFANYYDNGPSRPFCTTYIDPKLKLLRERFAQNVRGSSGH